MKRMKGNLRPMTRYSAFGLLMSLVLNLKTRLNLKRSRLQMISWPKSRSPGRNAVRRPSLLRRKSTLKKKLSVKNVKNNARLFLLPRVFNSSVSHPERLRKDLGELHPEEDQRPMSQAEREDTPQQCPKVRAKSYLALHRKKFSQTDWRREMHTLGTRHSSLSLLRFNPNLYLDLRQSEPSLDRHPKSSLPNILGLQRELLCLLHQPQLLFPFPPCHSARKQAEKSPASSRV